MKTLPLIPVLFCLAAGAAAAQVRTQQPAHIIRVHVPRLPALQAPAPRAVGERGREEELEDNWLDLRLATGPEIVYDSDIRWTAAERISEHALHAVIMPHDRLRLAAGLRRSFFELDQAQGARQSVSLTTFSLAADWRALKRLQLLPVFVAYTGRDAAGIGGRLDAVWHASDHLRLRLGGGAGLPWQDNTLAVDNDGRFHDLAGGVEVHLLPRLDLSLDANRRWYETGNRAPGSLARQGWSTALDFSLRYALLRNRERVFSDGFQDVSGLGEDSFNPGLSLFAAGRREIHHMREQEPLVPVIERSMDLRFGVEYNHGFSRHWGLQARAYAGHDPLREIAWRKLYGWNSRLLFIPKAHARFWVAYAMDAASGSAVADGREQAVTFGVNLNF